MDSSREWQGLLPNHRQEQAAHSQPRSFPINISSYFRRPAKVVKTNSRDNSPKNLARRRTTASHTTTRHHAALKGSTAIHGISGADSNHVPATTRPISWHPNSMVSTPSHGWTVQHHFPDSAYSSHYFTNPAATAQVNGVITPLTHPSSAESCYKEGFTPLEEMPIQNLDNTYSFPEQASYNGLWPPRNNVTLQYPRQPSTYREAFLRDHAMPFGYASGREMYASTAASTPDPLSLSHDAVVPKGDSAAKLQPNDEVLVGMGLYDAPSPPNSTARYGTEVVLPHRGLAGKGLKLEETFQPSNEETSDENGDDDGCTDDEIEDRAWNQQMTQHYLPTPIGGKASSGEPVMCPAITTLADQSFFFDDQDAEQDPILDQSYDQRIINPVWTDVYSGAPCSWV